VPPDEATHEALGTDGRAALDGRYYQADGAISRPLPFPEGGIPLWIADGGEKKTPRIAAQYADYTNFTDRFVRDVVAALAQ
jgi:alkanesulfonate monooxygenase SsuD/methylene tetrahydromethanopterin reductase-like flavin-dependent oxidoreductase (luciferase family)